jgi:hypothetical protein
MWVTSNCRPIILGSVLTVVGCLAFVFAIFFQHVLWLLDDRRNTLQSVPSIPVSVARNTAIPSDWVSRRFGVLQLRLPPSAQGERNEGTPETFLITVGTTTIGILPYGTYQDLRKRLDAGRQFVPRDKRNNYSDVMLIADMYKVSSDDFSLSMTNNEVARFRWLLTNASIVRLNDVKSVELIRSKNIEGLLLITSRFALFEWYAPTAIMQGSLTFYAKEGALQLDWVRSVCQTVSFVPPTPN